MYLRKVNYEESVKAKAYIFEENIKLFMEDKPSVHEANGYLSIYLEQHGYKGTFLMPNGMFNMPTTGNLIKSKMNSGKDMYFLICSFTQDYVSASGRIFRLCYVEDWNWFVDFVRIKDDVSKD